MRTPTTPPITPQVFPDGPLLLLLLGSATALADWLNIVDSEPSEAVKTEVTVTTTCEADLVVEEDDEDEEVEESEAGAGEVESVVVEAVTARRNNSQKRFKRRRSRPDTFLVHTAAHLRPACFCSTPLDASILNPLAPPTATRERQRNAPLALVSLLGTAAALVVALVALVSAAEVVVPLVVVAAEAVVRAVLPLDVASVAAEVPLVTVPLVVVVSSPPKSPPNSARCSS